jgi:hypothetical protein
VADFLSEAWLAELDDAARSGPTVEVRDRLVVEARVTDGPDGDVVFHLEVSNAGTRVHRGAADAASIVVETDHETATALHHGATNAQRALMAGRLSVRGDLGTLGRSSDAVAALGDVFGPVRLETTGGSLPG